MNQQHASNGTDRTWQRPTLRRLSKAGESAVGTILACQEFFTAISGRCYYFQFTES